MSEHAIGATPPPTGRGRPWMAALLGLGLGPLGVAVALDTLIDPALSGAVYLGVTLKWGGWGMAFGLLLCALYNAGRVAYHNVLAEAADRRAARNAAEAMRDRHAAAMFMERTAELAAELEARGFPVPGMARPVVIEAVPVVTDVLPIAGNEAALAAPETSPAPVAELPERPAEPLAPAPAVEPESTTETEPPSPPAPPAPRKRGRPKGPRKLAA